MPDKQEFTAGPTVPVRRAEATVPAHPVRDANTQHTIARKPASSAAPTVPQQPANVPRPKAAAPRPPQSPVQRLPRSSRQPVKAGRTWLLFAALGMVGLVAMTCIAFTIGTAVIYGGGVLPGVQAGGITLGGMSEAQAATALANHWGTLTLVDAGTGRTWNVNPARLGMTFDARATAAEAYRQGRGGGSPLEALTGVTVLPVLDIDLAATKDGLAELLPELEQPAMNAGVQIIDGRVQAREPMNGRALDIEATIQNLLNGAAAALADGRFELTMFTTVPAITDASGIVAAAESLLTNPLVVRIYDPVTGDIVDWTVPRESWASWLIPQSGDGAFAFTLDRGSVKGYLESQSAAQLDSIRHLKLDEAADALIAGVERGVTEATVRVYHHDRQHTVRSGESITSIAWDYGVPYPWVQSANPGVETLTVGQTITIPSPDNFLQFEPVPHKRIEVSISQQRTRVYENGQLKWDWVSSTGINSSPTWTGIYQIISHEPNAYAANWNLYMPNFLGVYQPIPGQGFTNGFHGFPTRGGGQLLWENDLGRRVTYGCILLSSTNAQLLYNWAEDGVVVEILP